MASVSTAPAATGSLARIISRYQRKEKLGEGCYGVVYKATDTETGITYAMKKVALDHLDDYQRSNGVPATTLREISLLRGLDHPNITRLHDVVLSGGQLYLVLEFLDKDLKQYMDSVRKRNPRRPHLSKELVKSYMYQVLKGLAFCHDEGVIHRDLKPHNLLIDTSGRIKLADFGLARGVSVPVRPYTENVVTRWYRPPEILLHCTYYATPVDIWSMGCIFAEMVNNMPLFMGDSELDQLLKIFQILGTPTEETWPSATQIPAYNPHYPKWTGNHIAALVPTLEADGIDLLSKMLTYEPSRRISARAALDHPYFDSLDKTQF